MRPCRKRPPVRALFVALLLSLTGATPDLPAAEPSDDDLSRSLSEYLGATAALGHFSGSVLVARGGRVLLRQGYGFASIEHRVPARPETRYRIASLTKQFAASAVLALRAKGLLKLDDPVARHLEDLPRDWQRITVRQLLQHTSGIADYEATLGMDTDAYLDFMSRPGVPGRILEFAKARPLDFEPGSEFSYSNSAYVLIGYLIEAVSGQSFEDVLAAELLEPVGLFATGHDETSRLVPHRATGYTLRADWTPPEFYGGFALDSGLLVPAPFIREEPPLADGGLYSTVDDLYRWDRALSSGDVLDAAALKEMIEPGMGEYGLGWFIGERFGRQRIWHTGVLPGFLSVFDRYPEEDATVILLGNTDIAVERLSEELAAILFGEPHSIPEAHRLVEITEEQFRPCVGAYRSDQGRVFEVSWDEMAVVEEADRFGAGMFARSPTDFYVPMFRGKATFVADDGGRIRRMVANIRGRSLTLERVEE